MGMPEVVTEPHCATCGRVNVVLTAGGVRCTVAEAEWPHDVGDVVAEVRAVLDAADERLLLDAADERLLWAAGLRGMADQLQGVEHAVVDPAYRSVLAEELRSAAGSPPDCEEAFRFRLCLLLDWHPKKNRADLDNAVEFARARGRKA